MSANPKASYFFRSYDKIGGRTSADDQFCRKDVFKVSGAAA